MSYFAKNMWLDDVGWGCFFCSFGVFFLLKAQEWLKDAAGTGLLWGAGDWGMDTSIMTAWLQADGGCFGQFWDDMFG